jgi:hypothetical protein
MPVDPKRRTIRTIAEAKDLHANLAQSAANTAKWLAAQTGDPMSLLRAMRFETVGYDPLTGEPLNIVEQLNQTFTILVTLRAIEQLFELHRDSGGFHLALGTSAGRDIESVKERYVAAEVFAATRPESNQKLKKDLMRLTTDPADHRYVFFYCPGFTEGRQANRETVPGIHVYAVNP